MFTQLGRVGQSFVRQRNVIHDQRWFYTAPSKLSRYTMPPKSSKKTTDVAKEAMEEMTEDRFIGANILVGTTFGFCTGLTSRDGVIPCTLAGAVAGVFCLPTLLVAFGAVATLANAWD